MAVATNLSSRPALRIGTCMAVGLFFLVTLCTFFSDNVTSPVQFAHQKAQQYYDSSQPTYVSSIHIHNSLLTGPQVLLPLYQRPHHKALPLQSLHRRLLVTAKIPTDVRDTCISPQTRRLTEIHNGFLSPKPFLTLNRLSTLRTHPHMSLSLTTPPSSPSFSTLMGTPNNGCAWLLSRVGVDTKKSTFRL